MEEAKGPAVGWSGGYIYIRSEFLYTKVGGSFLFQSLMIWPVQFWLTLLYVPYVAITARYQLGGWIHMEDEYKYTWQ